MQGQELCNTGPVDPQNITCMVTAEDGTYDFTLAARYDDDSLSPQSAAVPFTITTEATLPPVISLVGANPQQLEVGMAYMELASDGLQNLVPGDLTDALVIDASAVDTNTVGSYVVTYNVTDGTGTAAVEVTRTVIFVSDELSSEVTIARCVALLMVATPTRILSLTSAQGPIASCLSVNLVQQKTANGPIAVTSVGLGDQATYRKYSISRSVVQAPMYNLHWLGYRLESAIAARNGSELTVTYANQPSNPFDQPKMSLCQL